MKQTIITFFVASFLLSLQFILPQKEFQTFNDQELREAALERSMKPVPKTFEELLKVVDSEENPLTKEKIKLGKKLYFDNILSKNNNISCNTCHTIKQDSDPVIVKSLIHKDKSINNCAACHTMDNSGTDRFTSSVGADLNPYLLNVQTVLNSALAKSFTWSGEVKTIQDQIKESIQSHFKMNLTSKEAVEKLKNNPYYQKEFNKVFSEGINFDNISKAIDVYVKTLLTRGSYDKFLEGDNDAISDEAKQGFANFINFGCKGCHTGMGVGGQNVQRFPARNFARIHDLRPNFSLEEKKIIDNSFPFENAGGYKGRADTNFFRVPILRNVTKTSPYFHNGAVFKIREAVDIMAKHQTGKNLTPKQIDELVEFLKTLEGDVVDYLQEDTKLKGNI